jgi:hypothetical protein
LSPTLPPGSAAARHTSLQQRRSPTCLVEAKKKAGSLEWGEVWFFGNRPTKATPGRQSGQLVGGKL